MRLKIPKDWVEDVINGKYRGLSPEITVQYWECSICHTDFENCPHEVDVEYSGQKCATVGKNIEIIANSVVESPKDSRCKITDLLLVKHRNNGQKQFEWYGFELNNEDERFKSIQNALDHRLIPQKAALKFSMFFSSQLIGQAVYP